MNSFPKKIKLAFLHHIPSHTGFVVPINSLVKYFKEKGITMFVDGTNAMNNVQINIEEMQTDVYSPIFINLHLLQKVHAFCISATNFGILSNLWLQVIFIVRDLFVSSFGLERETLMLIYVSEQAWNIVNLFDKMLLWTIIEVWLGLLEKSVA